MNDERQAQEQNGGDDGALRLPPSPFSAIRTTGGRRQGKINIEVVLGIRVVNLCVRALAARALLGRNKVAITDNTNGKRHEGDGRKPKRPAEGKKR